MPRDATHILLNKEEFADSYEAGVPHNTKTKNKWTLSVSFQAMLLVREYNITVGDTVLRQLSFCVVL